MGTDGKESLSECNVTKSGTQKREIWTAETLFYALDVCENQRLKLALNVTFACSLRMGELLGLTWDYVEISLHQIRKGNACIYVDKELQRINKEVLKILDNKDVIRSFPVQTAKARTILVLKRPKTESSIRKVFLPKSVALMLVDWKKKQDENKAFLGEEYSDYNLAFAGQLGNPTMQGTIRRELKELITKHDLPPVVFHSFRHASITYKLKLNGGDIKAVQGDSGHAQATMVTDFYSHILDDSRIMNAQLFKEVFYGKNHLDVELDNHDSNDELSPEEMDAVSSGETDRSFSEDQEATEVIQEPPRRKWGRPKNMKPELEQKKAQVVGKKPLKVEKQVLQQKPVFETEAEEPVQDTPALDPQDLMKLLASPELAAQVQLLGINKK